MATTNMIKNKIKELKAEYNRLSLGKKSLLDIIDETELSENVFNSNAIENSTLSLKETEKILKQTSFSLADAAVLVQATIKERGLIIKEAENRRQKIWQGKLFLVPPLYVT
ncbi:hypothetical protein KKC16_02825, partial [Patescibacteria group bacterium]|nr:hypothetical protein [Patescibacteria group bacterium]